MSAGDTDTPTSDTHNAHLPFRSRALATLSGGRPGRAALILCALYVMLPLSVSVLCVIGKANGVLTGAAAEPTMGVVAGLLTLAAVIFYFGAWASGALGPSLFGEFYPATFRTGGDALMLLRLLLLLVAGPILIAVTNPLYSPVQDCISNNAETAALPALAARMPIPAGWELRYNETSTEPLDWPNRTLQFSYIADATWTPDKVKDWLVEPSWAMRGDEPFGDVHKLYCSDTLATRDDYLSTCYVDRVPEPGARTTHRIEVSVSNATAVNRETGEEVDISYIMIWLTYSQQLEELAGRP